jgi:hypothetical protein
MAENPTTKLTIKKINNNQFEVEIREGDEGTRHTVHINESTIEKFSYGHQAEKLIETSFLFLLEREPKVSILGSFDLEIIEKFFPEYSSEMKRRLSTEKP